MPDWSLADPQYTNNPSNRTWACKSLIIIISINFWIMLYFHINHILWNSLRNWLNSLQHQKRMRILSWRDLSNIVHMYAWMFECIDNHHEHPLGLKLPFKLCDSKIPEFIIILKNAILIQQQQNATNVHMTNQPILNLNVTSAHIIYQIAVEAMKVRHLY